jgi:hypothetical protein
MAFLFEMQFPLHSVKWTNNLIKKITIELTVYIYSKRKIRVRQ